MKRILLLLAVFCTVQVSAQVIKFEDTKHDFGTIQESKGSVTHVFTFKNTGDKPLILKHVQASCGCTTPEWPKQPIAPGKSAVVKAVFNPKNRSGSFHKSIRITSNATNGETSVFINGKIEKAPPTLEEYYRQPMGDLHFRSTYAAFTKIKNTEKQEQKIEFINLSDKDVKLASLKLPKAIQFTFEPKVVKPNQKGVINVSFDATKAEVFGYTMDYIYLALNDVEDRKYRVMVSSNVREDFDSWTEKQLKNAPHATFEGAIVQSLGKSGRRVTVAHEFGTTTTDKKVVKVFKFKNTGKSNLIIRRTKASCGCTAVEEGDKVIKPGKEGAIKVTFDPSGRAGKQSKSITVTLNDPDASTVKLSIKGTIEK